MNFTQFSNITLHLLHADIAGFIGTCDLPSPLGEATLYAMTNGGKRVRPLLVAATFLTLQPELQETLAQPTSNDPNDYYLPSLVRRAMLAVECLHGYSLVHDDLPCMDDDTLRRGRPTTHIAYGEATALLAGDVLQTLAFEAFTHPYFGHDEFQKDIVQHLALNTTDSPSALLAIFAPAARRMVMGQMLDLNGEKQQLIQDELEAIHRDKTGALIEASILMGAACGLATDQQIVALQTFAKNIGLAFQVQDDILDVTASTETLGKPSGSDEKLDKSTYIKLLGVEGAKDYAQTLFDTGKNALSDHWGEQSLLMDLANWLWQRQK